MKALTPASPHLGQQVSPLTPLCLPDIPPPTTSCAQPSLYPSPAARLAIPGFTVEPPARRNISAESGSLTCGLPVRLRLLSTPPRSDAVTFSYRAVTNSGADFHHANKASLRTHDSRVRGNEAFCQPARASRSDPCRASGSDPCRAACDSFTVTPANAGAHFDFELD